MLGPSERDRLEYGARIDDLVNRSQDGERRYINVGIEEELVQILSDIWAGILADVETSEDIRRLSGLDNAPDDEDVEVAYSVFGAADSWVSLASQATGALYGPQSPWPLGLGGWIEDVPRFLRRIAEALKEALLVVARVLRTTTISVGVSFPWGVSVGLGWNVVP